MRRLDPAKHEKKRQLILAAAGRCFARDGFRGASVADICTAARISPGHLYHYFASKEAIIDAMAERSMTRVVAGFAKMAAQTDVLQALKAAFGASKKRSRMQSQLAVEIVAEASRNPAVGKIARRHGQGVRKLLAEYLRDGQARGQIDPDLDAHTIAALLLGVMQGVQSLGVMEPDLQEAQRKSALQLLILRLLAPRPRPHE